MMGFRDNNYINWTICSHITTPTVVYVKGDQMMILLMSLSDPKQTHMSSILRPAFNCLVFLYSLGMVEARIFKFST